jgi:UDP-N-acetylmuramyl tripeptide synthase
VEPARISIETDLRAAIERTLAAAEPGETVYVLPTYTAMLEVREMLRQGQLRARFLGGLGF